MKWRVVSVVFGALPATLLGILAFTGVIAGSQALARSDSGAWLFLPWGALGVAGVIGLWLATLSRRSWVAIALVGCGLIAVTPFVWAAVAQGLAGSPSWLLLVVLPFGIGAAYIIDGLRQSLPRRTARL
jgi:hypothetical protein